MATPCSPSNGKDDSALFFPSSYSAVLHHPLEPELYGDEYFIHPQPPSLSAPLRVGPLEFRIQGEMDRTFEAEAGDDDFTVIKNYNWKTTTGRSVWLSG